MGVMDHFNFPSYSIRCIFCEIIYDFDFIFSCGFQDRREASRGVGLKQARWCCCVYFCVVCFGEVTPISLDICLICREISQSKASVKIDIELVEQCEHCIVVCHLGLSKFQKLVVV